MSMSFGLVLADPDLFADLAPAAFASAFMAMAASRRSLLAEFHFRKHYRRSPFDWGSWTDAKCQGSLHMMRVHVDQLLGLLVVPASRGLFSLAAPRGRPPRNGPRNPGPHLAQVCLYLPKVPAAVAGRTCLMTVRSQASNTQKWHRGFFATRLGNPRNPFSVQKFSFLGASATACGVAPRGLSRLMASGWPPEPPASAMLAAPAVGFSDRLSAAPSIFGQLLRVVACHCRRPLPSLRVVSC